MAYTAEQLAVKIAEIDAALSSIVNNGAEYTIYGSRTVKKTDIPQLIALRNFWEKKYNALVNNWHGRNIADFSNL